MPWKLSGLNFGLAARKQCTCRLFQLRACSASLGRSIWPLEPALVLPRAIEIVLRACPGATRALEIAAWACPNPVKALGIAARARPGAARAPETLARACPASIRALESPLGPAMVRPHRSRSTLEPSPVHKLEDYARGCIPNCYTNGCSSSPAAALAVEVAARRMLSSVRLLFHAWICMGLAQIYSLFIYNILYRYQ